MGKRNRLEKLERSIGKGAPKIAYIHVTPEGGKWYDRPISDPEKRAVAAGVENITVEYVKDWRGVDKYKKL